MFFFLVLRLSPLLLVNISYPYQVGLVIRNEGILRWVNPTLDARHVRIGVNLFERFRLLDPMGLWSKETILLLNILATQRTFTLINAFIILPVGLRALC